MTSRLTASASAETLPSSHQAPLLSWHKKFDIKFSIFKSDSSSFSTAEDHNRYLVLHSKLAKILKTAKLEETAFDGTKSESWATRRSALKEFYETMLSDSWEEESQTDSLESHSISLSSSLSDSDRVLPLPGQVAPDLQEHFTPRIQYDIEIDPDLIPASAPVWCRDLISPDEYPFLSELSDSE